MRDFVFNDISIDWKVYDREDNKRISHTIESVAYLILTAEMLYSVYILLHL